MRYYGCQLPWNPLQVLAWLLVPLFVTQYYFWYIMAMPLVAQIVLGIVFGAIAAVSTATGWWLMFVDPADPNVLKKRLEYAGGVRPTSLPLAAGQRPIENNFCRLCEVQVGLKSKHCRVCDKCVDVFDHHCKWLNTCIGARNYKVFMVYVSTTFATALFHCLTGVGILIECSREYAADDGSPILDAYRSNVPSLPLDFRAFIAVNAVFIVLAIVAIGLLGQLFFFHISLIRRGITTYDHIIQERQKAEDLEKQKSEAVKLEMSFVPGRPVPDSAASTTSDVSGVPSSRTGWSEDTASRQSEDIELHRPQGSAGGPMPGTPNLDGGHRPGDPLPPLQHVSSSTESTASDAPESKASAAGKSSTSPVRSLPQIRGLSSSDAVHVVSEADMMSPHVPMTPHSGMTTPHSVSATPRTRLQPIESEPQTPTAGARSRPLNLDQVVRSEPSLGAADTSLSAIGAPSPLPPNAVPRELSRPQY
eukprot:TRINITY_DN22650_c0_g1_i1.p1 TRINITY_DN22650_c0_g1~~TRINITY_DN22650_c0_g1_i1.p1  ORF type:complete len:476 (+),score=134.85 TRINITY_DN22650_c0_g1_i1:196-1623(+)